MWGATAASAAPKDDCLLQVDPVSTTWSINAYDPFSGAKPVRTFDVAFLNTGGKVCNVRLGLDTIGQPYGLSSEAGLSTRLPYTVVNETLNADITPVLGTSGKPAETGKQLQVKPGERELVQFSFAVDPSSLTGDGRYSQTVNLRAEQANGTPVGERPIVLSLDVTPSAVLGLKGAFTRTNGGARIDLGELTEGAMSPPVAVYVYSTRGYRMSAESRNNWRLTLAGGSDWAVPYRLSLGGKPIGANDTVDVHAGNGLREDSYPVGLVLQDVSRLRAGLYTDLITLSVAPL
jgi:hypothetical protein